MTTIEQDLAAAVEALAKATQGPWRWSENGNIVPEPYTDEEIAAVYTERDDDKEPVNATAILSAVTFLRQHAPAIADAVRDSERLGLLDAALSSGGTITMEGKTAKASAREAIDAIRDAAIASGKSGSTGAEG